MPSYEAVAQLPLEIESHSLEGLEREVARGFTRLTTVICLRGAGREGVGEDVTYHGPDHVAFRDVGSTLPLRGLWSFDDFSRHLDELDLFPVPPEREPSRRYRRWAFESAALDLALRQAGRAAHEVLGRAPEPVRFVVSLRLGEPPSAEPVLRRLELYPSLRFKLDPTRSWHPELIRELAATAAVDTVDLKGAHRGTVVENPPDPERYRQIANGFPEAWIEDPDISDPAAMAALAPFRYRITWDAVIESVADIEALPFRPRMVNVKPSRFGSMKELCDAYDYLAANGIRAYGGGQFELGPGRGQAQYLASMFHADAPNDIAPSGYNAPVLPAGLPDSPLSPAPSRTGFTWSEDAAKATA